MMKASVIHKRAPLSLFLLLGPTSLVGCGLFPWTKPEGEARATTSPPTNGSRTEQAEKKLSTAQETREELGLNDGFTLLYDLMGKESGVDKILILRNASVQTQTVIREISKVCATAKADLEKFAKLHPLLEMDRRDLPKAEVDTREAIEWATTKKLLLGGDFELKLILTQVSATEYAAFLTETLAERDKDKERKAWLEGMAKIFQDLHQKIVQRLTVKS